MSELLEQALTYAKLGLKVLPLHHIEHGHCSCGKADCASPGKHPRTKNGVKDAGGEEQQIRRWWGQWPEANIGLAMGKASGVIALDVDGEAGEESICDLLDELGPLPDSWEQLTGGGGRHLLFAAPGFAFGNKVRLLPGLDTRGEGGYIVAAPSGHISGRAYEWELSGVPGEVPPAPLPQIWLTYLQSALSAGKPAERKQQQEAAEQYTEGGRNDGLFRLGASLRAKSLSEDAILAALREENKRRCLPPLGEAEVITIAQSCGRYPEGACNRLQVAVVPELEPGEVLVTLKNMLPLEGPGALYADEVIQIVVALEAANSPDLFVAKDLLSHQKGYKPREFDRAVKMYKARRRDLRLAGDGDRAALTPLKKLLPEDDFLREYLLPEGWKLDGATIFRTRLQGETLIREVACPHLIFPVERMMNADTGTEKIRLSYYRDGEWRNVIVDKSLVAARREIVVLADSGVQVTSESAKHLITFLADFETANAKELPVSRSLSRLGWLNNRQFAPYDDTLVFDGEAAFRNIYGAIAEQGEFAAWVKVMSQARESLQIRALLAASFAAPLLWLLDGQCFFVHLWGTRSGIGKSVALQAALSAWGNPAKLWRSFNSTEVALERTAAFFHSLPVGLDELQTFNFQWRDNSGGAKKLVYKLAQGQGKGRGRKSGGVDEMAEWRTIFLSTGEQPLGEDLSTEGALARVIELYLTEGDYPANLTPPQLAAAVHHHYGQAGRRYTAALTGWISGGRAPLLELARDMESALTALNADYGGKQIKALSYLALGDCLSAQFIFGQEQAEATWGAVTMAGEIARQLATRAETDPAAQAWEWLLNWLAANEDHFYDGRAAVQRYGTIKLTPGGSKECCILTTILNKELQAAGYSPRAITKAWAEKGYIERGKDGNIRVSKWVGGIGVAGCYVISKEHLDLRASEE